MARAATGVTAAYPVMGIVFAAFLVIGMAMPVLPLHVHGALGFGPSVIGLVTGCQFVAALVSRIMAGRLSDSQGPRMAVRTGLALAIAGGGLYWLSLQCIGLPSVSVAILLVGRTLVGGAESLIITGAIAWALGLVPPGSAAKAIGWSGMAMFAAMAIGAPVGSAVFARWNFMGIALATIVISLAAMLLSNLAKPYFPQRLPPQPIGVVMKAVALPGLGFALAGITFGVVTAFLTLFFAYEAWSGGAWAFTGFSLAMIGTRLVGGSSPDRFGGARVALFSLVAQAAGLSVIATAANGTIATLGAILTGCGFSLVFPGFGIEAVQRVPEESRGFAMGAYNAYLDLTLGVAAPVMGVLASTTSLRAVFLVAAAAALGAMPIAIKLAGVHRAAAERATVQSATMERAQ